MTPEAVQLAYEILIERGKASHKKNIIEKEARWIDIANRRQLEILLKL